MRDLIAVTVGALTFLAWTGATFAVGWFVQSRRAHQRNHRSYQRIIDDMKRTPATPYKREPSGDVKRRAQA